MGGTFNATSSEAHDEIEKQRRQELKSTILHHSDEGTSDEASSTAHAPPIEPRNAYLQGEPGTANVDAARDAVSNAVNSQPFNPSNNPVANVGSQPLPMEEQSQQINIDDDGMVSMPGEPGQPPKDPNTPAIL